MRTVKPTTGSVAGIALTLCLALTTSGCSYASSLTGKIMGEETRTVPDGGQNAFGSRRAPVLNPGGALYRPDTDYEEQALLANNPYLSEDQVLYDNANPSAAAPPTATTAAMAVPVAPMAAPAAVAMAAPVPQYAVQQPVPVEYPVVTPGRRMPVENMAEAGMQDEPAPIMVPQATAAMANQVGYPELASVPPAPVRADVAATQAEFDRLADERAQAELARQQLMGQPVAPAAAVASSAVQNGPAPGEDYDTWLKRQLAAEQPPVALLPVGAAADASLPWQNSASVGAPRPVNAPEPVVAPLAAAPQDLMQPAPVIADSAPQPMPALEPIHLTPPPEVHADAGVDNSLPSPDGTWQEPIVLQQPAMASGNSRSTRFLADNRYTQRRSGTVTR